MVYLNIKDLNKIIKIISQGEVIALPTDTIFGLVCLANNQAAINKIYHIKNRPIEKPLPILVTNWKQAAIIGIFNDELIEYLDNNFVKGQITVVVKKQPSFNNIDYWNHYSTVAIRVTNSGFVKKIIDKTGFLVATSCNISTEEPINDAQQINLPLLQYVVEGKIINGKASTVYDSLNKKVVRL